LKACLEFKASLGSLQYTFHFAITSSQGNQEPGGTWKVSMYTRANSDWTISTIHRSTLAVAASKHNVQCSEFTHYHRVPQRSTIYEI